LASLDRRIVMKVNKTELSDKSDKTSINRHKCPITHGESVWHPYTLDDVLEDTNLNEPLPEEVPCKTHPDAPHGFNRNASHSEGRYVCDCEYWEPEEN